MSSGDGRVVSAQGLVATFTEAGLLDAPDVHVATMLARTARESDPRVVLAAALTARALRAGSVCLPLAQSRRLAADFAHREDDSGGSRAEVEQLPWPENSEWLAALSASALVGDEGAAPNAHPLRLVDGAVYLERYWCDQESVSDLLLGRCGPAPGVDEARLEASLRRLFGGDPREADQRRAVETAVRARTTVIAGGPGTGKTTTVARVVRAVADQWPAGARPRVALAAPTGKAAARLTEALDPGLVRQVIGPDATAVTLHRLLGARPYRSPRYGPADRLPFDLVVVDEMSMVSLSLMARLLEALAPTARLVMVGDPDQLTPVDAGAVLADITAAKLSGPDPGHPAVVSLRQGFRFDSGIARLADQIRAGRVGDALTTIDSDEAVEYLDCDPAQIDIDAAGGLRRELVRQAKAIHGAALIADTRTATIELDTHRLLCAHRGGPYGVGRWSAMAERVQRAASGETRDEEWFIGRPLLAGVNLPELGISNGDTGVVVSTPAGPRAAMGNGRVYPPFLLDGVGTMFAMTVHKSQGSQFDRLTLVLPPPDSPLLTRELLYTAITRARHQVRIIGPRKSLETAVQTPARRASGLTARLTARQAS